MSLRPTSLVRFSLLAALLVSCTTPEDPYTHIIEPLDLPDAPKVFVLSNLQNGRIVESLGTSGLEVTKTLGDANLLLRVRFGTSRGHTYECGNIRNLQYELRRANRLVLWMKGRGPTGRCGENIIDKMSVELATLVGT